MDWRRLKLPSLSISSRNNRPILELLQLTRPSQSASWFRPSMLAVFQNLHAIDENVLHPNRVLVRFLEGCPVRNYRRVKDNHIGEHPVLNETAVVEAEIRRGQGAYSSHRCRPRDQLFVACIFPEDAREIPLSARMRCGFKVNAFRP